MENFDFVKSESLTATPSQIEGPFYPVDLNVNAGTVKL